MNGRKLQEESSANARSDKNELEDEAIGTCPLEQRDGRKHSMEITKDNRTRSKTKTECKLTQYKLKQIKPKTKK